jgi:hypothetical protein
MKYTVNTYGWSSEFIAKTITKEQTNDIKALMADNEADELFEIRYDIDDIVEDLWDGDLLQINKPLNDGTLNFEILDENGEVVLTFGVDDIKCAEGGNSYNIELTDENDVWFTVDQFKGGVCSYEIESEEVPTVADFTYIQSDIEVSDKYWEIIDEILYKDNVLESNELLDSTGKSSYVYIFTSDDN